MKSRLIILLLRCLSCLSLRWQRRLGRLAGRLNWHLGTRMARITKRNLELCMPEMTAQEREKLARRSVIETCKTIAETGAVWGWTREKLERHIRVQGQSLLKEAAAEGHGVIVIGPHLGNWEVLGFYLNFCGLGQTVQLYQAPRDEMLGRMIFKARSRFGAMLVPTDARGVTRLLKALKAGQVVGILPDQVPPASGGEFAPFFGRPALTMTLLSKLIARTHCRAVLGYARRVEAPGEEGFEIVFREADERLFAADTATSLKGLNASIEAAVAAEPSLYQWEYKRFKRQPDNARLYN